MVIMIYFNTRTVVDLKLNLDLNPLFFLYIWRNSFGVRGGSSSFQKLWFLLWALFFFISFLTPRECIHELRSCVNFLEQHMQFSIESHTKFCFQDSGGLTQHNNYWYFFFQQILHQWFLGRRKNIKEMVKNRRVNRNISN